MFHGPGVRVGEMPYARTVDIVPTILKYLGVEGATVDGRPLPIFADDATNDAVLTAPDGVFVEGPVGIAGEQYTLEHSYGSYDRRIVCTRRSTGVREVLVPSVRTAFEPLRARPNISLELVGMRGEVLVLRELFMGEEGAGPEASAGEERGGREVIYDPALRQLGYASGPTAAETTVR